MSSQENIQQKDFDSIELPVKRVTGDTIKERLTGNAYHQILPARYLRKNEDGQVVETQEELFERVAKNLALADLVYEAEKRGKTVMVRPEQVRLTHQKREKLVEEVFNTSAHRDEDGSLVVEDEGEEIELTEENVNKFSYDTVVPEVDSELASAVRDTKEEFQEQLEYLSFIPNSPTWMNAGGALQQLSACFVISPDDDMDDIHETAKKAASVFKSGGGMGYGFWKLRPYGDPVGGSGGISSGPITFMRTYDQLCETIAQGGARRGAQMSVMRVTHPDIIQFIHAKDKDVSLAHTLRLNDPDDFTHNEFQDALEEARELIDEDGRVPKHLRNAVEGHLSNFNISVGITDDFMQAVRNDEEFTFTNPRTGEPHVASQETVELYETYGLGEYVEEGEVLSIPAREIWEDIIEGAHENGEPGVVFLERINKDNSFDVEEVPRRRIYATNPCVTGDTLISTGNGLQTAKELYEVGTSQDVVVDGRRSEEAVKEASSVFKTGTKEVFKIETRDGYSLRATAEHKLMTDSGWKTVDDIEQGDTIHVVNRKGKFGSHGTEDAGKVIGWLVGDGHLKHDEKRAVLNFYDTGCEISGEFESAVNSIVREPKNKSKVKISSRQVQTRAEQRERIRSTRLYEMADELGLTENKHQVPQAIMTGSEEQARGFLKALFTADGIVQHTEGKSKRVGLSSTSKELLSQVQKLLANFGVFSTIYNERREEGVRELPDSDGEYTDYECQATHELTITKENLITFREEIGFYREDKKQQLEELVNSYDKGPYSEKFETTVVSIESDGEEEVFDLVEPDTHSFVANGIVVHNCGEEPLSEHEACNLGHINLSTVVDEDPEYQDWRLFKQQNNLENPSTESVEKFLSQAIDWDELNERIDIGTHMLDNVVTMSDFPVEEISETVRNTRKIGVGVMGLAQLYVQLGVEYGSEVGNEIARQLMVHINHRSKTKSHELAKERGVFAEWEDSKYANPTEYSDWFEHHVGQDAEDWEDGFEIRNHKTTTVAPTGTTSMLGDTSGGIEPIFNVAYYKNVSDDVQGDEMLVEFDDYFLRTLEANDIDVDAVKKEAERQMSESEFSGVEGLSTVPDELGELFVTTDNISAKEHASVQCACQEGVDAAISKTVNAPNDATLEDTREAFEFVYENGGKGVTYYRDGTRSKQVMTTRAQNTEFSDMDAEEAVEKLLDLIQESEEARSEVVETLQATTEDTQSKGHTKRPRPDVLVGTTQRIDTGYGKMYVNINLDEDGDPFEVFINIGNSGGYTNSFVESLAKVTSLALRSGAKPEEIAEELIGTRSPKIAWDNGEQIHSIPDAVGTALKRVIEGEVDVDSGQVLEEDNDESTTVNVQENGHSGEDTSTKSIISDGESPECPDCGSMTLYYSEGCKTCESCGWSEC